ncbi:hypothetical protein Vi05172_g5305 [Venturia inaequalis]|nr:hypothetical protein Vi05172_g5305 [Venturia inaequalis]
MKGLLLLEGNPKRPSCSHQGRTCRVDTQQGPSMTSQALEPGGTGTGTPTAGRDRLSPKIVDGAS